MKKVFGGESYLQLQESQIKPAYLFVLGCCFLAVAAWGYGSWFPIVFLVLGFGSMSAGALWFIKKTYEHELAGIKNNFIAFMPHTARGVLGWLVGVIFTTFYICLYWFPTKLEGLIRVVDPLSFLLRGSEANQWFLYGTFYTLAVLVMGVRFLYKYRYNRYQILRTLSVMFFQLVFAYLVPAFMMRLNQPEYYFSYFWPLSYYQLFPQNFDSLISQGGFGYFLFFWGVIMSFVAVPLLTYLYGKRWYCSWVCGCGGLAETLGDPYRQLSDKSLKAWKYERVMVHSVIVLVVVTTILLWINSINGGALFGSVSSSLAQWYGFFIGSAFSGVIGVGFYPLLGSRVWCRFGCPLAGIMGIIQKFYSRFRITTNGSQCISCGNCSKYCEMGIDVRWYAQRGQNIVRASCVGCGVCSAVCPRGVLSLENGPKNDKVKGPIQLTRVTKGSAEK